jgi:hypothetical protein
MAESFDPYHVWLGIPANEQPPNHYRLLGVEPFESNADVITNAADSRMSHLRTMQGGKHRELTQQILNELSKARGCLLDAEEKNKYDQELRATLANATAPPLQKPPLGTSIDEPRTGSPPPRDERVIVAPTVQRAMPGWMTSATVAAVAIVLVVVAVMIFALRDDSPDVALNADGNSPQQQANIDTDPGQSETDEEKADVKPAAPSDSDSTDNGNEHTEDQNPIPADGNAVEPKDIPAPIPPVDPPADPNTPDIGDDGTLSEKDPFAEPKVPDPAPPEQVDPIAVDPLPHDPKTPEAPAVPERSPIPTADALREAKSLIDDIFSAEIAAAKSDAEKLKLANQFLRSARDTNDDPAARYELLLRTKNLAAQTGTPALALSAIERMGESYDVDVIVLKSETLVTMSRSTLSKQQHADLAERILAFIETAFANERADVAESLFTAASASAAKARDTAVVREVRVRTRELKSMLETIKAVAKAKQQLADNPDDAAANLAVGKFHCFVKNDWDSGLTLLAKGGDEALASAANLDLTAPTDPDAMIKVGDAWWQIAADTSGADAVGMKTRCQFWYSRALPQLTGLVKAKVSRRLDDLNDALAKVDGAADKPDGAKKDPEPELANVGMLGRVEVSGRDVGLVLRYQAGTLVSDELIRSVLSKNRIPSTSSVQAEFYGVIRIPKNMNLTINHQGGSSSGGVITLYIDGKRVSTVGDDTTKSTSLEVPLRTGYHTVRWVLSGGHLGRCQVRFLDRQSGDFLPVMFNQQVLTKVNSLPTRAKIDLSKVRAAAVAPQN